MRVGNSRVTLDLVIEQYEQGMTPEDMVRAYDTLALTDVYAALAYYLRHQDDVRQYIAAREEEAAALQKTIQSGHSPITREELLTRRRGETADAAAGQ